MRLIPWLIRAASEVRDDRSIMSPVPMMSSDQHARVMSMIADPPRLVEHRCPKCGTLIHADIVHGGFGPCRKCGWTPDQQQQQQQPQ